MRKIIRLLLPAVAVASPLAAPAADRPLSIATGGTGGVYYPLGVSLAELWTANIGGIKAEARATGGAVENIKLLESGDVGAALGIGSIVHQAYHGSAPFAEGDKGRVLAIGALYPNPAHIVTLSDSGIRSLSDLNGKRVSVGAPGSGTEVMSHDLLSAVGISFADLRMAARLSFTDTADAVGDGRLDAGILSVGLTSTALLEMARAHPMALVCMSEAEQDAIVAAHPFYRSYTIPARTYAGVEAACPTIQVANQLVVRADEDADLVYRLTKVMYQNLPALVEAAEDAAAISPKYAMDATVIPLHPGALRYYQEVGVAVPEHLLP